MQAHYIFDPAEHQGQPYLLTSRDFSITRELDPTTGEETVVEMKQQREHLPKVIERLAGRTLSESERVLVGDAFDAIERRDRTVTLNTLVDEIRSRELRATLDTDDVQ